MHLNGCSVPTIHIHTSDGEGARGAADVEKWCCVFSSGQPRQGQKGQNGVSKRQQETSYERSRHT